MTAQQAKRLRSNIFQTTTKLIELSTQMKEEVLSIPQPELDQWLDRYTAELSTEVAKLRYRIK
jgi:hypothetical protein